MDHFVPFLLVFSITLFIASLLSDFAGRSVFSISVLFLLVGALIETFGLVRLEPSEKILALFADTALLIVLFTDGMHSNLHELKNLWKLPGTAILVGMPLTILFIAIIIRYVLDLSWMESFLVGAILSPTDPVFASMLVASKNIPSRLRHLLNLESGLNDGLALPIVIMILNLMSHKDQGILNSLKNVGLGITVGFFISWLCVLILKHSFFKASRLYGSLFSLSVFLMVFSISHLLHANEFLAVFIAGMMIASSHDKLGDKFRPLGMPLVEVFKLLSLLAFGMLISLEFLKEAPWSLYLCALLILFLARPLAIEIALVKSPLTQAERGAAAWFGPRGFASVVFSLQILKFPIPHKELLFHLLAITIGVSIILHSSTDVPVASWLEKKSIEEGGPS